MDRDEILKRSWEAREDEGAAYAVDRGRRAGIVGFCGVYIALKLFNLWMGQRSLAPDAMFWAYVAAEAWGRYRITQAKGLLATVCAAALLSLGSLGCYAAVNLWKL